MTYASKSTCSKCGTVNIASSSFCFRCGNKLKEPLNSQLPQYVQTLSTQGISSVNKFGCSKCGTANLIGSYFCSTCGSELKELQQNPMSEHVVSKTLISNVKSKTYDAKSEFQSGKSNSDAQTNFTNSENYRRIVFGVFRCKKESKEFRVKIEEKSSGIWLLTQASPIESGIKAYHEKLDIEGSFEFDNYDGCPHCGAMGIILCTCGRIFCWNATTKKNKCPWCHNVNFVDGVIRNIKAGADV